MGVEEPTRRLCSICLEYADRLHDHCERAHYDPAAAAQEARVKESIRPEEAQAWHAHSQALAEGRT